ncbi:SUPPRESSOR OF GAMMA RESPONSE 1 isoform X1 [Typha angustifolia]|uniref:SUPPRESSOR OF GAMMA RESPONSE 1 isoform X1 n=1 Tax=Typha angustifolia TaxID=59011 RepID=UPI003C2FBD9D
MARAWLVTSRGIAKKIKSASRVSNNQINDFGLEANRECPNCKHIIDNSDVTLEWPGLPAGVKFDPSDLELLEHLEGKVGLGNSASHMFIDEFIPTLEEYEGICYTHPENLPGIKKDGSSVHFFHRISNAYTTGHRKRRKINSDDSIPGKHVRWHKTGKTKPIIENGVQKGWKKIMVLYKSSKRGSKPGKANWVMHQYHLGTEEDEKDGELVVSKIFYQLQTKPTDMFDMDPGNAETDMFAVRIGPTTPKTNTPEPPRPKKNSQHKASGHNENSMHLQSQVVQCPDEEPTLAIVCLKDEGENPAWLAGESQAVEELDPKCLDDPLLCHEVLDSFPLETSLHFDFPNLIHGMHETIDTNTGTGYGFSDLDNIELGTPPDLQLSDLQFGSQESISSWLDRL